MMMVRIWSVFNVVVSVVGGWFASVVGLAVARVDLIDLSEHHDVRLVSRKRQHDHVSICTIETIAGVGREEALLLHVSQVGDDLVLSLARHLAAREHDVQRVPIGTRRLLSGDELQELVGDLSHEFSAGSDAVRVEHALCVFGAFSLFLEFSSRTISPRTLLVQFSSWGDSINGEINEDLRFDEFFYEVQESFLHSLHHLLDGPFLCHFVIIV
mmetsp:Transcript_13388/g.14529  ORF Transcript_13388/g.14529 Transcript_13388/m.14529 type:complete len:213 (+) Transcript_13388:1597-2235(+)